jgi:DNA-binding winged helix-turn-helix (wHTH) protein/TolB-like protein
MRKWEPLDVFTVAEKWSVIPASCEVEYQGRKTKLTPRAMAVLQHLAEHAGEVVMHEALLDAHWPHTVRSLNAVHKIINELRDALDGVVIETIRKRGYRLNAKVDFHNAQRNETSTIKAAPSEVVDPVGDLASNDWSGPPTATFNGSEDSRNKTLELRRNIRLSAATIGLVAFVVLGIAVSIVVMHSAPQPGVTAKSVAVLRFRNLDNDDARAFVADGLADALQTNLRKAPGISVVDRDKSFQHSISNEPIQKIGVELAAEHLLEGSVEWHGDQVRVSVALYRSRDGERLYDYHDVESIDQIIKIQDRVVANVLSALDVHLDGQRSADMRDWGTQNVDAYLAAMEANSFHQRLDQKSLEYAAERYRKAFAIDPAFVNAYTGLAETLVDLDMLLPDPITRKANREEVTKIRKLVEHLDPSSTAFPTIAFMEQMMGTMALRETEVQTRAAIQEEGTPHRAVDAYLIYADLLISAHLFHEASQYLDLYERFERNSPWVYLRRKSITAVTVGPRAAIPMEKQSLTVLQNNVGTLTSLVANLAFVGEYDEAEHYLSRLRDSDQYGLWAYVGELYLRAMRGDFSQDEESLQTALASSKAIDYSRGLTYFVLGDIDHGVDAWRRSLVTDVDLPQQARYLFTALNEIYFPAWIVADPRYQRILDEFGIGREWTKYMQRNVVQLAPITGVTLTDSGPQAVVASPRFVRASIGITASN